MSKASIQISPAAYVCPEELELEARHNGRELRKAVEKLLDTRIEHGWERRMTMTALDDFITDVDDDDERDMLETFAAEIRDDMYSYEGPKPTKPDFDFDVIFHSH